MCLHETGIEYVQGKLENISDSRGSFVFAIDFGRAAQVVRSGSDGRAVEFFLFPVDGSAAGGGGEFFRGSGEKNHAGRIALAARNGFHHLGGRRPHLGRTFLGDGGLLRRILFCRAHRPGSLRTQTKILNGDIYHSKKNLRVLSCAWDKGGEKPDPKIFL